MVQVFHHRDPIPVTEQVYSSCSSTGTLIEMDVNFPLYIEGSLMHSDIYGEFSPTYWNALANPLYIEGKMHIHIYQYISISGYCPFNLTSPGGPWYGMVFKEGLCGQCGKYALSHTPITDYAAQDCI